MKYQDCNYFWLAQAGGKAAAPPGGQDMQRVGGSGEVGGVESKELKVIDVLERAD